MKRGSVRVTLKLYRFELLVTVVAGVLGSLAAVYLGLQLAGSTPTSDCIDLTSGGPIFGDDAARCPTLAAFSAVSGIAGPLLAIIGLLPFFGGGLIGSQLVAREIDQRTAQFAWFLAPARTRWLLDRVVPPLLVLTLTLAVVATASAYLEAARAPALDVSRSFNDYGLWGPLLIFRGMAVLGIGVLVGAILGRVLPALLVTGLISAALFLGLPFASTVAHTLVPLDPATISKNEYPLYVVSGWRTPDGGILSQEEARSLIPTDASKPGEAEDWLAAHFESVTLGLPGSQLPAVQTKEALLLVIVGTASLSAAAFVLDRRRLS